MIDEDVVLGAAVTIFDPALVNIFGCRIGDGSFIGPFVEITRGVDIGKRCKIESHSFLCDSVTLGDEVFIGHGVVFTNDLYPKIGEHVVYAKTEVQRGASLGSNATIIAGVTIGAYAIIGAGSVVTKDIPAYSIAAGNPAKVLKHFSNREDLEAYIRNKQPRRA